MGDERELAGIAHNLGILFQSEVLALAEGDPERRCLLDEAVRSVEESLALSRRRGDEVRIAGSLSQLGVFHRDLGALDEAERRASEALAIHERLDLPHRRATDLIDELPTG